MASSAYYRGLIDKYEGIKEQVAALAGSVQSILDYIVEAKPHIDELIINYETIDKGELNNLTSVFEACNDAINAVIVECQTKIDEYTDLYKQALAAEYESMIQENGTFYSQESAPSVNSAVVHWKY